MKMGERREEPDLEEGDRLREEDKGKGLWGKKGISHPAICAHFHGDKGRKKGRMEEKIGEKKRNPPPGKKGP